MQNKSLTQAPPEGIKHIKATACILSTSKEDGPLPACPYPPLQLPEAAGTRGICSHPDKRKHETTEDWEHQSGHLTCREVTHEGNGTQENNS